MSDKIKVEPFMIKKGNRVGKASIEFLDGSLQGFHLIGFTICDDEKKGMYVMFPASIYQKKNESNQSNNVKPRPFYFLRPQKDEDLETLQNKILDVYDSMTSASVSSHKKRGTPEVSTEIES